jgi:hypothetical protein
LGFNIRILYQQLCEVRCTIENVLPMLFPIRRHAQSKETIVQAEEL